MTKTENCAFFWQKYQDSEFSIAFISNLEDKDPIDEGYTLLALKRKAREKKV